MSYQQYVFALIAKIGGSKDKAVVDPTLCKFMGNLQGGVFLSQLLYWSDKGKNKAFYKTYKEWEDEIFLSKYEVNKAASKCVEMGFLKTWVQKAEGNPTVHYLMLQDEFIDLILKFVAVEMESQNFDEPLESEKVDEPKSKSSLSSTETTAYTSPQKKEMRPPRAQAPKKGSFRPPSDIDPLTH